MALCIFSALGLGVWASELPRGAARGDVLFIHKSFGATVLFLIVVRIIARLVLGSPAYAIALGRLTHAAAYTAHVLLYALMIAMPVSGYLTSTAGGHEVSFFGLFALPNLVRESKPLDEGASQAHYVFAWTIGVILALHLLAVVWHAWIKRDSVLTRMWPRFQPYARVG
jgi:cytochrome b561